jgi:hypothetical protein
MCRRVSVLAALFALFLGALAGCQPQNAGPEHQPTPQENKLRKDKSGD